MGSVSIVRRFDSPKIQLKLKLALYITLTLTLTDTGGAVLTLTDTGDLLTIEQTPPRMMVHDTVHNDAFLVSS